MHSNHLYSRNRNRGSISSWRRLFNRNENLRLSLTRYLAIASPRERLKQRATQIWSFEEFFLPRLITALVSVVSCNLYTVTTA